MARHQTNPLTAQDTKVIRAAHRRMHRAFLAGAKRHPQELVQLSSGDYTSVQYWPGDPSAYVWVRGERWRVPGRPTAVGVKLSGDPKTATRRKVPASKARNPAPKSLRGAVVELANGTRGNLYGVARYTDDGRRTSYLLRPQSSKRAAHEFAAEWNQSQRVENPSPRAPKRARAGRPLREGQRVYHCAKRCR